MTTATALPPPDGAGLAAGPGPDPGALAPPSGAAGPLTAATQVALRTIRQFARTPQLLLVNTVQGAMFLLIFRYVFGGAIDPGPVAYVDFLVPGFVVTGVLFTGMGAATGVAEDVEKGFFDRLRSLPVARSALLGGRVLADTALVAWGAVATIAIGFAIGFRIDGSVGEALAAFGLCVAFGFAFVWLFAFLGLVAGSAQAAQGTAMLVFPLSFVSSAYVPVESMPGWMQPVAEHQPLTAMTNAVRSLTLGDPAAAGLSGSTAHWALLSLAWAAAIVAVFAPLAVSRYRRS